MRGYKKQRNKSKVKGVCAGGIVLFGTVLISVMTISFRLIIQDSCQLIRVCRIFVLGVVRDAAGRNEEFTLIGIMVICK